MDKHVVFLSTARSDQSSILPLASAVAEWAEVNLVISGNYCFEGYEDDFDWIFGQGSETTSSYSIQAISPKSSFVEGEVSVALGEMSRRFYELLENLEVDCLVIMGDRWELWPHVICALALEIPIVHISGGEHTFGAIDERVRYSVSKAASIHFVAAKQFADSLVRVGEAEWRIFLTGEIGLDGLHQEGLMPQPNSRVSTEGEKQPYFLATVYPEQGDSAEIVAQKITNLMEALEAFPTHKTYFSSPAIERGSGVVKSLLKKFERQSSSLIVESSFGRERYLSLLAGADAVIGNSSSGIVEAPTLAIPTVNIGDRQLGRPRAASVFSASFSVDSIRNAIQLALGFRETHVGPVQNPFDPFADGLNTYRASTALKKMLENPREVLLSKEPPLGDYAESDFRIFQQAGEG